MGYKFQFVTLAGFHALNLGMFDLALSYKKEGMLAYSKFQQRRVRPRERGWLHGDNPSKVRRNRLL